MTYENFLKITNSLKTKIVRNHIENISIVNKTDFIFSFSFNRKDKLFFSLNNMNPFIYVNDQFYNIPAFNNALKEVLKVHIKDSYILNINVLNEDRVLEFELVKNVSLVLREKKYLILECIPKRPRLIILNEDKKILFSTSYDNILNNFRIIQNTIYEPPIKKVEVHKSADKDYDTNCKQYIEAAIKKGIKERHEELFLYIERRIKSLNKKIEKIKEDKLEGINALKYKEYGDMVYILEDDELIKYLQENNIQYDTNLSKFENANRYYKKYKKAKGKIEASEEQEKIALEEKEYLLRLNEQLDIMDEKDIPYLEETLLHKKDPKLKRNYIDAKLPYFITYKDVKIGYGLNDAQNDNLTFERANKNNYFFHIDKYSGPHVVVFSENLNQDLIDIASDIAIYFSKQKEGNVISTRIKNVKKTSKLGLVNLSNTILYRVDKVSSKTVELLNTAKKFSSR